MHPQTLGQRLKERREILSITQQDLAELSGTGLRTIKALEKGSCNPTLNTINTIAGTLGMELLLDIIKPTT